MATGYVYEELCMWHNPGKVATNKWVQPSRHWEDEETKRRIHNLLAVSGLLKQLHRIDDVRPATEGELAYFHTTAHIERIKAMSAELGGDAGEDAHFSKGGYEIAALSAGGGIALVDSILTGKVENGYALLRPPGHHAVAEKGMGFCIFNNIVIAAHHALRAYPDIVKKIAIIDYDVHHGNGTEDAFYDDPRVLFISIHQDGNYPKGRGLVDHIGTGAGLGTTINIPLPPGSGEGAYHASFERVVEPAVHTFKPDLILVSSGFDASYMDPMAHMMLSSDAFRFMAASIVKLARTHCNGRAAFMHEGGYSDVHVPFCGLAVMEELSGYKTEVEDPFLEEAQTFGQQAIQPHQTAVIDLCVEIFHCGRRV